MDYDTLGREIKRCKVPKNHFDGKKSEYYFTKHSNHLDGKSLSYETPSIKVILPEFKRKKFLFLLFFLHKYLNH